LDTFQSARRERSRRDAAVGVYVWRMGMFQSARRERSRRDIGFLFLYNGTTSFNPRAGNVPGATGGTSCVGMR